MFTGHKSLRILLIAGLAVPTLAAGPNSPTTQPAAQQLFARVWTCPTHEQLRLFARGTCPIDGTDLVRRKVTIEGPDALGDPYPLATCPVTGLVLGENNPPIVLMHDGREVRFCSSQCIGTFQADPAGYLASIDTQIIEQQLGAYPLTTCPVSQELLGSMGDPVDYVYNNRLVRFCCTGCLRGFKKNPGPVLAILDKAVIAEQLADYPSESCPISGETLGSMGAPIDYVIANRLVRLCCTGCVSAFYKNPAPLLAELFETAHSEHEDSGHGNDHDDHGHDGHDGHNH